MKDRDTMPGLLHRFCTMALPWHYLSRHERLALVDDVLYYSDGLIAGDVNGRKTIRKGDYVLVEDSNVFAEACWNEKEIIAYSEEGYASKEWVLPASWRGIGTVDVYRISLEGVEIKQPGMDVADGRLTLSLEPGDAVSIVPQGTVP